MGAMLHGEAVLFVVYGSVSLEETPDDTEVLSRVIRSGDTKGDTKDTCTYIWENDSVLKTRWLIRTSAAWARSPQKSDPSDPRTTREILPSIGVKVTDISFYGFLPLTRTFGVGTARLDSLSS